MASGSKGDIKIIEAIDAHVQKHIGQIAIVFHEKTSPDTHVDIFHVAPSSLRPFHSLLTCGMSERAMITPRGWEDGSHAELLICLPESWPVDMRAFQNEEYYWPVRILKALAHYPHENKTWLYAGHSVLCNNPPRPFARNTKMTSVVLRYPRMIPTDSSIIKTADGRLIRIWAVIPLYKEEWEFKDRNGFEALEELFCEN